MAMPDDLILVRHGESEGNIARRAERAGDPTLFTDKFVNTPGHRWSLTDTGKAQAACTGAWLQKEFITPRNEHFSRYYVSPFVRTKQTAGHLGLHRFTRTENGVLVDPVSAAWRLNRALRERDWGDIGTISTQEFESRPEYKLNARARVMDPLYSAPPGGESIAEVAENRVRNFLDTLHREQTSRVLAVVHGELIMAVRLVLERLSDEQYELLDRTDGESPDNGEAFHYSRYGPERSAEIFAPLTWLRRARPVYDTTLSVPAWRMEVGEWQRIQFRTYTNAELIL